MSSISGIDESDIIITDLKIHTDGRISIRDRALDRHGIEEGDTIDATVYPDGVDRAVNIGEVKVKGKGRINPKVDFSEYDHGGYADIVIWEVWKQLDNAGR